MKNLIMALALVAITATSVNAGWTVIYDFYTRKPVVIYTPDHAPAPVYRPYNPYVYPAPCPYDHYRPAPRYDYHRHDRDRGRNHRNPCR